MTTFDNLKAEIRNSSDGSRYGRFLDALVFVEDRRGQDPNWDLWYFSDNTDFCRRAAAHFLSAVEHQIQEHDIWTATFLEERPRPTEFAFEVLRREFGAFLFYVYSALESFAHETNIFYRLALARRDVSLARIRDEVLARRPTSALAAHIRQMELQPAHDLLRRYRNTVAHGYVFPVSGGSEGLRVPDRPQHNPFTFAGNTTDLLALCRTCNTYASAYICQGWRSFERDELTAPP